jgi:hypothetical protein
MTQIGLDFDPPLGGIVSANDHSADMGGPCAGYVLPPVMMRKFIGETAAKVICLADIYRIPTSVSSKSAEDVDSTDRIECDRSEFEVFKLVRFSADAIPSKGRLGVD